MTTNTQFLQSIVTANSAKFDALTKEQFNKYLVKIQVLVEPVTLDIAPKIVENKKIDDLAVDAWNNREDLANSWYNQPDEEVEEVEEVTPALPKGWLAHDLETLRDAIANLEKGLFYNAFNKRAYFEPKLSGMLVNSKYSLCTFLDRKDDFEALCAWLDENANVTVGRDPVKPTILFGWTIQALSTLRRRVSRPLNGLVWNIVTKCNHTPVGLTNCTVANNYPLCAPKGKRDELDAVCAWLDAHSDKEIRKYGWTTNDLIRLNQRVSKPGYLWNPFTETYREETKLDVLLVNYTHRLCALKAEQKEFLALCAWLDGQVLDNASLVNDNDSDDSDEEKDDDDKMDVLTNMDGYLFDKTHERYGSNNNPFRVTIVHTDCLNDNHNCFKELQGVVKEIGTHASLTTGDLHTYHVSEGEHANDYNVCFTLKHMYEFVKQKDFRSVDGLIIVFNPNKPIIFDKCHTIVNELNEHLPVVFASSERVQQGTNIHKIVHGKTFSLSNNCFVDSNIGYSWALLYLFRHFYQRSARRQADLDNVKVYFDDRTANRVSKEERDEEDQTEQFVSCRK